MFQVLEALAVYGISATDDLGPDGKKTFLQV
jgi:hypothetical protein